MSPRRSSAKPINVVDGLITRTDVDSMCQLLGPDVLAGSSCPSAAPHRTPRLRINVSGQTFELPVSLLARHPGIQIPQITATV